jgi:hypothetical protein
VALEFQVIDLAGIDFVGAVTSMESREFWGLAAFLGCVCVVSFVGAFRSFRRARLIEDIPTSKIRSAHQGYVELEGHAAVFDERGIQESPLDGRACVWWAFKIERRNADGDGNNSWDTVEQAMSKAPFVIDDDTGRCAIRPEGATAKINLSRTWYGATERPTTAARSCLRHSRNIA